MKRIKKYFKNFFVDADEAWEKVLYYASRDAQGDVLFEAEDIRLRRAVWKIGGLNFIRNAGKASLNSAQKHFVENYLGE